MERHYHPYHLVEPSPYPYLASMGALGLTGGSAMYFHSFAHGGKIAFLSLILILVVSFSWFRDVAREGTYQGWHTLVVQRGIRYGMLLFILSEVLFFFSFFWAFFHSSLGPDVAIGAIWPPIGIEVIDPFQVPLLNTAILLTSGATVTWSHNAMIAGDRYNTILALVLTIILAAVFTGLQAFEYYESSFAIWDSVYGTTFFVATGFHGLHVIIGSLFLTVCLFRIFNHHFTKNHHNGFEAAIWYWHFVDYVWIFLFVFMYWWGS